MLLFLAGLWLSCAYHPSERYPSPSSKYGSQVAGADSLPLDPVLQERFKAEIRRFWQAPYVWGGASPQGTDCSGLVHIIYQRAAGVDIPRLTGQLFDQGWPVPVQRLRFTDLVFFNMGQGREPRHVGLYVDRGFFIHASVSSGVMLSRLSESPYRESYLGARRYLQ